MRPTQPAQGRVGFGLGQFAGQVSHVYIDFITDLLKSNRCINVLVIINRLSKDVILEEMEDLDAETVA